MTRKSDHKHNYEKCILRFINISDRSYGIGDKCSICGKIKVRQAMVAEKVGDYYTVLDADKILEKYSDLEIIDYKL